MSSPTLIQYTDPNCTWSWGSEPVLRRVEALYGDQLSIEFVLGGLVEDFEAFHDAANGIEEPADVAPHWEAASARHGMPVDASVWHENPPQSTYPAGVATKAAGLQDPPLELRYLRRIREVAATEVRNVAERDVLVRIAEDVCLDVDRFLGAIDDGRARKAFEADLRTVRERRVRGFPTYRIEVGDDATTLGGFQRFDHLEATLVSMVPGLERRDPPPVESFVATYGYVATREVAEVYEWDVGKAEQVLAELETSGAISATERGNGKFWTPAGDAGDRLGTGELSQGGELVWDA